LTTFPGLGTTGTGKVENGAHMTRFSGRNLPTLFGVQFLSFPVSTVGKRFGSVLTTFQVRAPPEQEKLKTGPIWLGLALETYQHFLGYNSYRFPSVRLKNVWVEFWRLSRARAPPEQVNLKIGPGWLGFGTRNIPTVFGTYVLSFPIPTAENGLRQILTTFSGPGTTGIGKVENRAPMTRFFTRNIPTVLILIVSHQYDWKIIRSTFCKIRFRPSSRGAVNWTLKTFHKSDLFFK